MIDFTKILTTQINSKKVFAYRRVFNKLYYLKERVTKDYLCLRLHPNCIKKYPGAYAPG